MRVKLRLNDVSKTKKENKRAKQEKNYLLQILDVRREELKAWVHLSASSVCELLFFMYVQVCARVSICMCMRI